jgi:hypothetical protein
MEEPTIIATDQGEPLNVDSVATELSVELPVRPPSSRTSSLPRSTGAENEATEGESTASKYVEDLVLNDLLVVRSLCCGTHSVLMPPIANMSLPGLAYSTAENTSIHRAESYLLKIWTPNPSKPKSLPMLS